MVQPGQQFIQFRSCEETLVILAALIASWIAFRLFRAPLAVSALIGALAGAIVVYITLFEFTLDGDVITYRNRFRQTSFPLSYVKKVGMSTFWMGLPGHTFVFIMQSPPAEVSGYFFRTGLVSWPSAAAWVAAVNAESQRRMPSPSAR